MPRVIRNSCYHLPYYMELDLLTDPPTTGLWRKLSQQAPCTMHNYWWFCQTQLSYEPCFIRCNIRLHSLIHTYKQTNTHWWTGLSHCSKWRADEIRGVEEVVWWIGSMTSRCNCEKRCSRLPRMCRHRQLLAVLFDNEQRGKRTAHSYSSTWGSSANSL